MGSPTKANHAEASASFPVALNLVSRKCVLIGSAPETAMRARQFVDAGAALQVISESPDSALLAAAAEGAFLLHVRAHSLSDLAGTWLVVLTDQSSNLAATLAAQCESQSVFFCAVDQPDYSSFGHVAVARAGTLWAAVGTSGRAPALASRLRQELQRVFDESGLARIVEQFVALREQTAPPLRRTTMLSRAKHVSLTGQITDTVAPSDTSAISGK